nr:hypothetical protein CFP56_20566 [Quercus suber]
MEGGNETRFASTLTGLGFVSYDSVHAGEAGKRPLSHDQPSAIHKVQPSCHITSSGALIAKIEHAGIMK